MTIYLATDHAGFALKEKVKEFLIKQDYKVEDCGAYEFDKNDDYPDFIGKVGEAVSKNPDEDKAIIFGLSGQGEAIVANKFKNVRAAVYYGGPNEIVSLSRKHNNANVLSLGARFLSEEQAIDAVKIWLNTPFENEERHLRRVNKIKEIESRIIR